MFYITRDIKIEDVQNGAKDFHFCRRHRLSFNPAGFCKACGDLRPPLMKWVPDQLRPVPMPTSPPWPTITNIPYTGPIYGGTTTSPNTITWDPGNPTFTMTNASSSAIPAGSLFYSSDDGSMYTTDGTNHIKIGDAQVRSDISRF